MAQVLNRCRVASSRLALSTQSHLKIIVTFCFIFYFCSLSSFRALLVQGQTKETVMAYQINILAVPPPQSIYSVVVNSPPHPLVSPLFWHLSSSATQRLLSSRIRQPPRTASDCNHRKGASSANNSLDDWDKKEHTFIRDPHAWPDTINYSLPGRHHHLLLNGAFAQKSSGMFGFSFWLPCHTRTDRTTSKSPEYYLCAQIVVQFIILATETEMDRGGHVVLVALNWRLILISANDLNAISSKSSNGRGDKNPVTVTQ